MEESKGDEEDGWVEGERGRRGRTREGGRGVWGKVEDAEEGRRCGGRRGEPG